MSTKFFPQLISGPFINGLKIVLWTATALSLLVAILSVSSPNATIYNQEEKGKKPKASATN
jgi:hypothetical protein